MSTSDFWLDSERCDTFVKRFTYLKTKAPKENLIGGIKNAKKERAERYKDDHKRKS